MRTIVEKPTAEQAQLFKARSADDYGLEEAIRLAYGMSRADIELVDDLGLHGALRMWLIKHRSEYHLKPGRIPAKVLRAFFEERGLKPAFLYPKTWKGCGLKGLSRVEADNLCLVAAVLLDMGVKPGGLKDPDLNGKVGKRLDRAGISRDRKTISKFLEMLASTPLTNTKNS